MIVRENISFERGKDPKEVMDVGAVHDIIDRWNTLQQKPGVGSLNLRIQEARLYLEVYVSYMPGSILMGQTAVEESFGKEFFDEIFNEGPNLYCRIKEPYEELFQRAFRRIYGVDESISFERGRDPKGAMGIGRGVFQKIMDDTGWEPAELRLTRDRLDQYTGWGTKEGFQDDLEYSYKHPEYWNIDKDSGYYADIEWALDNIDDAWELVNLPKDQIYPDKAYESVHFERGKDPKKALEAGMYDKLPRIVDGDYFWEGDNMRMSKEEIRRVLKNAFDPKLWDMDYGFSVRFPDDTQKYMFLQDIAKDDMDYIAFDGDIFDVAMKTYESVNFERGKTVKQSLELGRKEEVQKDLMRVIDRVKNLNGCYYHEGGWPRYTKNYRSGIIPQLQFTGNSYVTSWEGGLKSSLNKVLREFGFQEYLLFPARDVGKNSKEHWMFYQIKPGYENLFEGTQISGVDVKIAKRNGLLESVHFERGKDPKRTMGIGIGWENLSPGTIIKLQKDLPKLGKYRGDLFKIKGITNLGTPFEKRISYIPVDKNFNELKKWSSSWDLSKDFFEKTFTLGGMRESISFERGRDPKDALGIGDKDFRVASILAKFAKQMGFEEEEPTDDEYANFAINNYGVPTIVRKWVRRKGPKYKPNYKGYFGHYNPSNYLDRIIYPLYPQSLYLTRDTEEEDKGEYGVHWYVGKADRGSSGIDQFDTLDKWIKLFGPPTGIKESVNFERGKDPKRAMKIGGYAYGPVRDLEWGITDQRFEDVLEKDPEIIRYKGFTILLYQGNPPDHWHAVSDIRPVTGRIYAKDYHATNGTDRKTVIRNMKRWISKYSDLTRMHESLNFERGKDPRDTMGIGNRLARVANKYDLSIEDAKEIVYVLRVLFPDDFSQEEFDQNVFTIANEFDMSELQECGLHPEDQNFATLKWVDNNIQKGWELYKAAVGDSVVTESVNFERGKDPKQSMGIGIKNQIKRGIVDMIKQEDTPIYAIDYYDENSDVRDYLKNTFKIDFGKIWPNGRTREEIVKPIKDYLSDYIEIPYSYSWTGGREIDSYYFKVKPEYLHEFRRAFLETVSEYIIPR